MKFSSACIIWMLFLSQTVTAQEADAVMKRYLEASGGQKLHEVRATQTLRWIHSKGKDTTFMEEIQQLPYFIYRKSWRKDPGFLTLIIFANGDGSITFSEKHGHRQLIHRKAEVNQLNFSMPHRILRLYEEKGLTFLGDQSLLDKTFFAFQTKSETHEHQVFYFDKISGLLFATKFVNEKKTNIAFHDDYRTSDGLNLPYLSRTITQGDTSTVSGVREIRINMPVDTTFFYPKTNQLTREDKTFQKIEILPESNGEKSLSELISQFQGKRILIDIWATWCAPCKFEFGLYDDKFYDFLFDHKIEMLFVSIDEKEKDTKWRNDIQQFNINGYHTRAQEPLMRSLRKDIFKSGEIGIPRYILIDESGNILNDSLPKPSNPEFKKAIQLALKGL